MDICFGKDEVNYINEYMKLHPYYEDLNKCKKKYEGLDEDQRKGCCGFDELQYYDDLFEKKLEEAKSNLNKSKELDHVTDG